MADRYRDRQFPAGDDYGRADYTTQPRAGEGDPLAELARLIGQTDPFSTFGREQQQAAERRDHYPSDDPAHAYEEQGASTPAWIRNRAPAQNTYDLPYEQPAADPYADARGYDERAYDAPLSPPLSNHPQDHAKDHAQDHTNNARYDDVLYGHQDRDPHQAVPFQVQDDRDYESYDDAHEPPTPKRGGLMTVIVVLALAVVGTGAAFAYRTFVGSPRSGEPPVIKADAGPNKIVAPGAGDKQITDRLGDKPPERVVSREEQPVDINGKAQPRVVFPPLSQNTNAPNAASANPATRPTGAGIGNGTLGGDEPRKIRTLSIRPGDGSDQTAAAAPAAAPASAPVRQIPPATRAASAAAAPSSTASAGGPIALTPQAQAPVAETRPRVASVAPAATNGGGAYVQVSSQKTEVDAQASFRALQAKYSGILGAKPSSIRRADLGDKGVFYRAMVGPFANAEEATQFCVNLKSAGGQCVVQR